MVDLRPLPPPCRRADGCGSNTATKRLLQVRLAPHLAHLHDLLTLPSTGGMMRGELLQ